MALADILDTNDSKRTFETSKSIEITKNTVKFGSSVYQFRNVTGFRVGDIPKNKFPLMPVIVLTAAGMLTIALGFGWILLIIAIFMVVGYFNQTQYYGLSLYLNSGQERFFVSTDKNFLVQIVSVLYDFMESQSDGTVNIDLSNRSVNVGRDLHGTANTGDKNLIH